MAEPICIELDGPPRGKGRPRFVTLKNWKRPLPVTPPETRAYENSLRAAAKLVMVGKQMLDGPLQVSVEAHFPVPASWSKSKRAAALTGAIRPTKKPDADNLMKVLDSLNEVVWRDDAQIVEGAITKLYSDRPRLVVRVGRLAA